VDARLAEVDVVAEAAAMEAARAAAAAVLVFVVYRS